MAQLSNPNLLVKKALALGVPEEELQKLTMRAYMEGGTSAKYHDPEGWCETMRKLRRGTGYFPSKSILTRELTLHQFRTIKVCGQCGLRIVYGAGADQKVIDLGNLVMGADVAKSAQRYKQNYGKKTSMNGRLKKLQDEIVWSQQTVSQLRAGKLGNLDEVAQKVEDLLEKALRDLRELSGGEAQRAKIAGKIRAELIPVAYQGTVELDSAQTMVGFAGTVSNRKIDEVLDAYSIRNEDGVRVLLCPRYVYDYLNRAAGAQGSYGHWLLTAAAAPDTPEIAEVAAALWDPRSKYGHMQAAVQAAEAVTA